MQQTQRRRLMFTALLSAAVSLALAGCGQTPVAGVSLHPQATTVSSELRLDFPGIELASAAADLQGNLIVGGGERFGNYALGLVRKLDAQGHELWSQTFAGSTHSGFVGRVKTDRAGNVYFLARFYSGGGYDNLTKLAPDGSFLWNRQSGFDPDVPASMDDLAVDAAGNAYVVGRGERVQVIKYSPGGERLWASNITPPCQSGRIAANAGGLVYTNCQQTDGGPITLTQYKTDGSRGYQKLLEGYYATDVAVSPAGSSYSLRHDNYYANRSGDLLSKYDVHGVWQWYRELSEEPPLPPSGSYWHPNALAVSDAAKVYVGGGSQDTDSIWQGVAYLQKRDPDSGNMLWRAVITCPTPTVCETRDVAVGGLGKVWAVGSYGADPAEQGSFVARFAQ